MNIERAIVGLQDLLVDDPHFDPELRREAVKLGIEALKDFKRHRGRVESGHYRILPGETKD